ncbi:helix-turn-helix transcriptional regulator [Aciditerrimonas ferrireducens]|uniref:helix-turn-helix transcriptional regulator n=1 Tax=Aciditerrimonas ferrireducens TaxID=667306 RepID=UPI002002AAC9|nr:WYL domain-containing protein [Aciditerrimonas ferrireducens]MCK4176537.1 WYL domain-containing protein [Aciditerrimonas ferrireducens]
MDRLERLTNLVLTLLQEGPPKTLQEIADAVPGYPPPGEARRQAFERDKRTLREQGIVVSTLPVPGPEQVGYRIRPEDFYLQDLDLTPEEQVALNLAVAAVHGGDASGRLGLWRLGAPLPEGPLPEGPLPEGPVQEGPGPGGSGPGSAGPTVAEVPLLPALPVLFSALSRRQGVRFRHGGQERRVVPAQLRFHRGWWYLVGWDVDRRAGRTYRVDRIEDQPRLEEALGPPPEGFDPEAAWTGLPWRAGQEEAVVAQLRVAAPLAPSALEDVGPSATVAEEPDGSVVLTLEVTNRAALRSWLLDFGEHAELLGPPALREELIRWLEGQAEGPTGAEPEDDGAPPGLAGSERRPGLGTGGRTAPRTDRGSRDAGSRLLRLLAVLTVLARQGRMPLRALADRFGTSPEELQADLELAACCGLPPYTPDQLMEIIVGDEEVEAHLDPALARPRRLTPAEGLALVAAGRAVAGVPGLAEDGAALAQALAKLEASLGARGVLSVDLDEPAYLPTVRRALEERQRLAVRYWVAGRDEEVAREVDPVALTSARGHWYLVAQTPGTGDLRRYRVDRILAAEPTGRPAEASAAGDLTEGAVEAEATVVQLAVDAEGRRLLEGVPALEVEERPGGGAVATLAVSGEAWLGRLLVRLGPHGRLLAPASLASLGPTTARRILQRYGKNAEKSKST